MPSEKIFISNAREKYVFTGASEGNLVWYGQPCEIQFTREGRVAETNILEIQSPHGCILLVQWVIGPKGG